MWAYGVMVSTRDSESLNPGSNPGRPYLAGILIFLFFLLCSLSLLFFASVLGQRSQREEKEEEKRKEKKANKKRNNSESRFRSSDLWVMSPTRFRCANSLLVVCCLCVVLLQCSAVSNI